MEIFIRARVNDINEIVADRFVTGGIRLSVNGLWPGEDHLSLVSSCCPECGVELFPIRSWLKTTGQNDRAYPDPRTLTAEDIRGIIQYGVIEVANLLESKNLNPKLIYVMTEPSWRPNSDDNLKVFVADLYARIETAIACVWPNASQMWYIAGRHHTLDQRHPEWPSNLQPVFVINSSTLYRLPEAWHTIDQISYCGQAIWVGLHCWYDSENNWHTGQEEQLDISTYEGLGSLINIMKNPPETIFLYSEYAPLESCVNAAIALSQKINKTL